MKKQIKKYGATLVITFNNEEVKANKLKIGQIMEVNKVETESKSSESFISDKKIEDVSNVLLKKDGN